MRFYGCVLCSLFIYKVTDTLTDNRMDVTLEWKLPVDEFLAFNIGTSCIPFWHVFAVCVFSVFRLKIVILFTVFIVCFFVCLMWAYGSTLPFSMHRLSTMTVSGG